MFARGTTRLGKNNAHTERYVFIKVALDDTPAVFLADDAFVIVGLEVVLAPVCHDREESDNTACGVDWKAWNVLVVPNVALSSLESS